jgi:signal transduction histidine kinase
LWDAWLRGSAPRVRDIRWQLAAAAAASAAMTIAFAAIPGLQSAYRAASVHVALETTAALVSVLAMFLVFGRLQREARVADLLLACGLAGLAVSNFLFREVPAVFDARGNRVIVWSAVGGRLLAAILLAAAAIAPRWQLSDARRAAIGGALAAVGIVVATGSAAWLLRSHLPAPGGLSTGAHESARNPALLGHPAFAGIQLLAAALYAIATFGFARRAMHRGDDFFRWLALACVLSVFSRINYFLYPSSYTDWVYLGDVFRLGFFAVLLVAATREIAAYWRLAAEAAGLNERRRLARDLHDGLAQELAFLRSNIGSVEERGHDPDLPDRLAAAAKRAEDESRRLLAALSARGEDTLDILLTDVIRDVAAREHVRLDLDVATDLRLDHLRTEALVRIAAEAVTNAARHAGTDRVRVVLEQAAGRVRLRVIDRGRGFDPPPAHNAEKRRGFGLVSMHGRADAVGADFSLSTKPGKGTTVEVLL